MATLEELQKQLGQRGIGTAITGGDPLEGLPQPLVDELLKRGLAPVETSPLPTADLQPPPDLEIMGAPVGGIGLPEGITRAAEAGVLFREGAPTGRGAASFGVDMREAIKALQVNLTDWYQDQGDIGPAQVIDVRQGPDTGKLEFFNPKENRYNLVDAPGLDLGDFQSMSGEAVVAIPDVAATLGISIMTLNPVAGIAAGSGGAFGGEYARLKAGQIFFGINDDLTEQQMILRATKVAGWSAAGGTLGTVGARILKGINNLWAGRSFSKDALELSAREMDEASEVITRVNAQIDGKQLQFTAAQASDDPDLLAYEEMLRKALGRNQFREFDRRQNSALREFWNTLRQPFESAKTAGSAETGRQVQKVVGRDLGAVRDVVEGQVGAAETAASQALAAPPKQEGRVVGPGVRELFVAEQTAYQKWAKKAARNLDDTVGHTAIKNKDTRAVVAKLTEEGERGLLPGALKAKQAVVGKVLKEEDITEEVIETNPLLDDFFSFEAWWDATSELDRRIRIAGKGLTADVPAVGDLKLLKSALEDDAERSLKGTNFGGLFDDFRSRVRIEKDRLDRSVIATVMGTNERMFKIADERVFDTIFRSGTERDAGIVADALAKDPQALQVFREGIFSLYETMVAPKGVVEIQRHNKFMKDFGPKLRQFFPTKDIERLERVGGLQEAVEGLSKRRQKIFKAMEKSFEGNLESIQPDDIMSRLWKPGNPDVSRINDMKRILQDDPLVLEAVKAQILRDMDQRIAVAGTSESGRVLSFRKFDNYLFGTGTTADAGHMEGLKALFGKKYGENLELLRDALRIAQREGVAPNRSNTASTDLSNALNHLVRAGLGMFTAKGRAFTAAKIIAQRNANRVMLDAMMDPQKMKLMQELSTLSRTSKRTAIILGQLGGLEFADVDSP